MSSAARKILTWVTFIALGCLVIGGRGLILPVKANTPSALKKFNSEVLGEPGCPVQVFGAACELELDPFGAAVAARHYIDYRNVSNRAIAAVKFRIGYVNTAGIAQKPYSNGFDDHLLQPGEQAECRFRGDHIDPGTVAVKVRVLKVKFSDGTVWDSAKDNPAAQTEQQGFIPLTSEPEVAGGQGPAAVPGLSDVPAAPPTAPAFAAPSSQSAQMPTIAPPAKAAVEPDMPPHVPPVHLTGPSDPMAALDQALGTGNKKTPPAAVTSPAAGASVNNAPATPPASAPPSTKPAPADEEQDPQLLPPLPVAK